MSMQESLPHIERLQQESQSLMLATLSTNGSITGTPHISYAPFVEYEGCFYIFVSGLAAHTKHLLEQRRAQMMLIDDEAKARNIFARMRLIYDVEAHVLARTHEAFNEVAQRLRERHGGTVEVLLGLNDFVMFALKPQKGTLVTGFGQAFVFEPNALHEAVQLTDKNIESYR